MTDAHTLIGAYLVDAVDDVERALVERHLTECDDCAAEAASMADVTASLAAATATALPDQVRSQVLTRARQTPQRAPRVPARGAIQASPGTKARRLTPWLGAAAAAVAGIALTASVVAWWPDQGGEDTLAQDVMVVTSAPDAHSMDLGWAGAHVVMSEQLDAVAVMGAGAPLPAEGMEYQTWFVMRDGTTMAGPTFAPDEDGGFMAMAHADCDDVAQITVTVEPRGGSPAPTSAPLAQLDMHHA